MSLVVALLGAFCATSAVLVNSVKHIEASSIELPPATQQKATTP